MKKEIKTEKLLKYVGKKKGASWALYQDAERTQHPLLIREANKITRKRLTPTK